MARLASSYLWLREAGRRQPARRRSAGQEGQGMAEYGLILVLIAVVVVLVVSTLGKQLNNTFSNVSSGLGT